MSDYLKITLATIGLAAPLTLYRQWDALIALLATAAYFAWEVRRGKV